MSTNNLTTRSGYHPQSDLPLPQEDISPGLGGSSQSGTEAAVEGCVLVLVSLLVAWLLASNFALRRAVNARQREPAKKLVQRERTSAAQRWRMVDLSLRCFWSVLSLLNRTLHYTRYGVLSLSATRGVRCAVLYNIALSSDLLLLNH